MNRLRLSAIFCLSTATFLGFLAYRHDAQSAATARQATLEALLRQNEENSRHIGNALIHVAKAMELLHDGSRKNRDQIEENRRELEEIKAMLGEYESQRLREPAVRDTSGDPGLAPKFTDDHQSERD